MIEGHLHTFREKIANNFPGFWTAALIACVVTLVAQLHSPELLSQEGVLHEVVLLQLSPNAGAHGILEVLHEEEVSQVEKALQIISILEILRDVDPVHEIHSSGEHLVGKLFCIC